jgi:hypothetical protein
MARHQEVHELALTVALAIPETENVRVHEDLTDVALALSADAASAFVPRATEWLKSPFLLILPEKLGLLVAHLARGGRTVEALGLARALLAVRAERLGSRHREAHALFSTHQYKAVLEAIVPPLATSAGSRALPLLSDLLEQSVRITIAHNRSAEENDYSYIWRPSIGAAEHEDVRDLLVSAVRDAAAAITTDASSVRATVEGLESRPLSIFKRIALWILASHAEQTPGLVEEHLTKRDLFEASDYRQEYAELARHGFPCISSGARDQLLRWITQGPDRDEIIGQLRSVTDEEPPPELVDDYIARWTLGKLHPIASALTGEWKHRYEELIARLGEPKPRSRATAIWHGPESPLSLEELRKLSPAEVLNVLASWTPDKEFMAPSREGLASVLRTLVAEDPPKLLPELARFHELPLVYIRAVVGGFHQAAKQSCRFDWQVVLDFCRRIPSVADADELHWTRAAVASLLSTAFESGDHELPIELRQLAWDILYPLTDDSDPTPERERPNDSRRSASELAINSTRGEAMHAAVRYGLWVRRASDRSSDDQTISRGFDEMPELRSVLEHHLNPTLDPSLAIRSIYGQWFPWLVLLDSEWAKRNVGTIFPRDEAFSDYRTVAWDTYVTFCPAYDNVLPLLRGEYEYAIDHLGDREVPEDTTRNPARELAEHVMALYWRGRADLRREGLVSRFYLYASDAICARAFEFIGRALSEAEETPSEEQMTRLRVLWEERLTAVSGTAREHAEELGAFGWWFGSGRFDPRWALIQLQAVIDAVGTADPEFRIAEQLARNVVAFPFQTVRALGGLLRGDEEGWRILSIRDDARTVLAAALASSDMAARAEALKIVNDLGAEGFHDFRDLLPRST